MISTGYSRDQDVIIHQVWYGKTTKTTEDNHGKLELYSLPDDNKFHKQ